MIVAVKLSDGCPVGNPGEVLHLEEEKAQQLVDAGWGEYAGEEDVGGGEAADESPEVVENAVQGITKKAEAAILDSAKKAVQQIAKNTKAYRPDVTVPAQPKLKAFGFRHLGDFANTVSQAKFNNQSALDRLENTVVKAYGRGGSDRQKTPSAYNQEGVTADGGYLVPLDYSQDVFQRAWGDDPILSRLERYPLRGNDIKVRALGRYQGAAGGATSYWVGEGVAPTLSKEIAEQVDLTLKKLMVMVPVTSELIEDEPESLEQILNTDVAKQMTFALNDAILNGGNSSSQANIVSDASTIAITRTTANIIQFKDLTSMYSRVHVPCLKNLVCLYTPAAINQLLKMTFTDTSGTFPAWVLPGFGSSSESPTGRLLGIPTIPVENAKGVGHKGDIGFYDFSQVACAYKELQGAASMHLYFDLDMMVFRFRLRIATKSLWTAPWTRADGITASPFVILDSNPAGS